MKKTNLLSILLISTLLIISTLSLSAQNDIKWILPTNSNKPSESLFPDNSITISAVNGSKTIAEAEYVFPCFIAPEFKSWGLDEPDKETPKTNIMVHKTGQNASSFKQIFSSFNVDLDKLCLTQHQIIEFCAKERICLKRGARPITLFLFKNDGKYYVTEVFCDYYVGLSILVFEFEDTTPDRDRPCGLHLVIPQL